MTKCKFSGTFFGETNQGMVRTNNEDTYICQQIWDDNHILCAAIDGLGGYEGGEIAAELARTTIIKKLEDFASTKTGELLKAALIAANNEIVLQHEARPKVSQMGCVASIGIIDLSQGIISIAHVGDSRIYQFANGELKKLTHDHSLVGFREETGELSEEDAMNHPKRNVIDKFLGDQHLNFDTKSYIEVSVWPVTTATQFIFCSDGLTDLVTSSQITAILSSNQSIADKVRNLIACANSAGGKDNITVVIAEITPTPDQAEDQLKNLKDPKEDEDVANIVTHSRAKRTPRYRLLIAGIIGLILGGVAMTGYYKLTEHRQFTSMNESEKMDSLIVINNELLNKIDSLKDSISRLEALLNPGSDHLENTTGN